MSMYTTKEINQIHKIVLCHATCKLTHFCAYVPCAHMHTCTETLVSSGELISSWYCWSVDPWKSLASSLEMLKDSVCWGACWGVYATKVFRDQCMHVYENEQCIYKLWWFMNFFSNEPQLKSKENHKEWTVYLQTVVVHNFFFPTNHNQRAKKTTRMPILTVHYFFKTHGCWAGEESPSQVAISNSVMWRKFEVIMM